MYSQFANTEDRTNWALYGFQEQGHSQFANIEYNERMIVLKPQHVAIVLKLLLKQEPWTIASLATELVMSASEVHAGLHRSVHARLYNASGRQVRIDEFEEFMFHGLKFVFIPKKGAITRGLPTSYAAPPLNRLFDEPELPPVWPHAQGTKRGYELAPLYRRAAEAARSDSSFYELLALTDAIRDDGPRVRKAATDELRARFDSYRKSIRRKDVS